MRTNYAGFALAVGMGLLVVLMGLLGLSAAGLTGLAPGLAAGANAPADSTATPHPAGPYGPGPRFVAALAADSAGGGGGKPGGDAVAIAAGDALFKNNCAQCHAVNEKVVGPALAGITKRRSMGWLVNWVRNSSKVIANGDDYAVKLFNDNGQQQMPAFPQLSDKDINAIMAWVTSQEGAAASAGAVVAAR